MINLNDMVDGDIKYELDFGVEFKDSSDFFSESEISSPWSLPLFNPELIGGENPANNLMVNPNSVIPLKRQATEVKVEKDPLEDVEKRPQLIIKQEEESEEDDDDEEEEEDEDDEDEEYEVVSVPKTVDVVKIKKQEVRLPDSEEPKKNLWTSYKASTWRVIQEGAGQKVTTPVEKKAPNIQYPVGLIRMKPFEALCKSPTQIEVAPNKVVLNPVPRFQSSAPSPPSTPPTIKAIPPISIKKVGSNPRTVLKYITQQFPKPAYSYSCLIAMALKNSSTGSLPVSEIYNFMCEHFPYFESAPPGWKNSVRHNLSLNKCFEKIEKVSPTSGGGCRKGCLWAMNPEKISKMDDEVAKWSRKDPQAIKRAMRFPDDLEKLEKGDIKIGARADSKTDVETEDDEGESDVESEENPGSDEQEQSGDEELTVSDEEGEVPPSLKPFDSRLSAASIIDTNIANDIGIELPEDMCEELGLLQQVMSSEEEAELFSSSPGKRPRLQCVVSPMHRQPVRPV